MVGEGLIARGSVGRPATAAQASPRTPLFVRGENGKHTAPGVFSNGEIAPGAKYAGAKSIDFPEPTISHAVGLAA